MAAERYPVESTGGDVSGRFAGLAGQRVTGTYPHLHVELYPGRVASQSGRRRDPGSAPAAFIAVRPLSGLQMPVTDPEQLRAWAAFLAAAADQLEQLQRELQLATGQLDL